MNNSMIMAIVEGGIIGASLLAIVFTFGVVWRVEKKLDTSFKLLLISITCFLFSEISLLSSHPSIAYLSLAFKVLFVIFFLAGIFEIRQLIKKIDGEDNSTQ